MRKKKLTAVGAAAIWAAFVIGAYNIYACCAYVWGSADVCRRMTSDTVESSVTYEGVECDLDSNSLDDDLASGQFDTNIYHCGSTPYCLGDTTYCGVAYHCGLTDTDIKVYYHFPSSGHYGVIYGSCGTDCLVCQFNNTGGDGDTSCPF